MKIITNIIALVLVLFSFVGHGQTSYYTGFDSDKEKLGWQEYQKGKMGAAKWEFQKSTASAPTKLVHYAPTGDANKDSLVDWFVSPEIDLTEGGRLDSLKYNYFTYFNTHFPEQKVEVYILEGNSDPSMASGQNKILDLTANYQGNSSIWMDTGDIILPINSGKSYLAFKFVAIDGWSSISFDNLYLTLNKTTSKNELSVQKVSLFPNPVNNELNVQLNCPLCEGEFTLEIMNVMGATVMKKQQFKSSSFYVDLVSGIYFCRIYNKAGSLRYEERIVVNK